MTAQSIAMMEGAGKAWQFGKRKISAKSNEEFNAFTYQNMWSESVANINSMLPELREQFHVSAGFQKEIFKHMFDLVPIFINEMAKATGQLITNLSGANAFDQSSTNPAPTQSNFFPDFLPEAYADDTSTTSQKNKAWFQNKSIKFIQDWLKVVLNQGNPYQATTNEISLAKNVLHTKIQQGSTAPTIPSPEKISTTSKQDEFNSWNASLFKLQKLFLEQQIIGMRFRRKGMTPSWFRNKMSGIISSIKTISNDYRNPNNLIQKKVMQLRQEIANGSWTFKY